MLSEAEFWAIVDGVHARSPRDMQAKCDILRAALRGLPGAHAIEFQALFSTMMSRAFDWDLWAAALLIGGLCSDDSFIHFRSALISMGRSTFESAVADAESLAEGTFDPEQLFFEGYDFAVTDGVADSLRRMRTPEPSEPTGTAWADGEDLRQRFPRLSAKYAQHRERYWS